MIFLRLLPVFISFLLMAAHLVRAGQMVMAFVLLALLLLLLLKKNWVPWVIQFTLLLGAVEWLRTLFSVAQMRIEFGMPWTRMAIILGAVALFTALSCLVFHTEAIRSRFSGVKNTKLNE
ncbi:MAG: hypothetical protein WBM41_15195 [Arenicellales bacterium]